MERRIQQRVGPGLGEEAFEEVKIQATIRQPTIHRYKEMLSKGQFRTTVRVDISNFIPKLGLTIIPFTELLETKEDSDFLVDVLGLLMSMFEEKEYDKDGKNLKIAVMELAENEYAEQLVALLQLAKVKVSRGSYNVPCFLLVDLSDFLGF
ncbi:hypothetical protein Ahy_B01g054196 [Arachis hypogaea]|uniref:Uncharacterized protein n=1 Tax=Arachis hypogaea TaxID=3818 RepID=A0A445ATG8_ARAHY|nr:hypothetical protein Ahy_B01g054196 [Arachis hypogaea]